MIFGYARVSTTKQSLEMQIDELEKYQCDEIVTEKESGAKKDRKELSQLLSKLRKGDKLVVYKLASGGLSSHSPQPSTCTYSTEVSSPHGPLPALQHLPHLWSHCTASSMLGLRHLNTTHMHSSR